MRNTRRTFLNTMTAGLMAGRCHLWPTWGRRGTLEPYAPSDELVALSRASAWINTPTLDAAHFEGKVVLVQFWTFTCINWLRTLPYVRAWSTHYEESGLVVVGVHTPEFGFERTLGNVQRATPRLDVEYPVAVDPEYRIWRAFNNNYWPALYLFDGQGKLRYRHFGEGEYQHTEGMIRRFLKDVGSPPAHEAVVPDGTGAEAAADWSNLRSPETYLGDPPTNGVSPPGRLSTAFHARDAHLVMGPPPGAPPVRFRVTLDGAVPGAAHGFDIDERGDGIAREQRLYQLIRQPMPILDRVLSIEFLDPGVEAFAFTFG